MTGIPGPAEELLPRAGQPIFPSAGDFFTAGYLQLSAARIPAHLTLGNTLTQERRLELYTPEVPAFLARHGGPDGEFGRWLLPRQEEEEIAAAAE